MRCRFLRRGTYTLVQRAGQEMSLHELKKLKQKAYELIGVTAGIRFARPSTLAVEYRRMMAARADDKSARDDAYDKR